MHVVQKEILKSTVFNIHTYMVDGKYNFIENVFSDGELRKIPYLSKFQSHIFWDDEFQKESEINEFGYRSDSFERRDINVLSIGCSFTFGLSVLYENTWSYQLCDVIRQKTQKTVSNWNLSAPGASNDYISRTLLTTINTLQPDIVVVLFVKSQRREHFDSYKQYFYNNYYKYHNKDYVTGNILKANDTLNTEESNYINFFKNYKLVELLLKDYNWCYGIVPSETSKMDTCVHKHRAEYSFLNEKQVMFEMIDKAKDGKHPGVQTYELFAKRVYEKLYESILQ